MAITVTCPRCNLQYDTDYRDRTMELERPCVQCKTTFTPSDHSVNPGAKLTVGDIIAGIAYIPVYGVMFVAAQICRTLENIGHRREKKRLDLIKQEPTMPPL